MGALLSAPLTCCGSLLGSCAATAACKACSCACTVSRQTSSIIYVVIMVCTTFMAIGFRYSDQDIVIGGSTNETEEQSLIDQAKSYIDGGHVKDEGQKWWNERFGCAPAHPTGWIICCANTCAGVYSVYRFSFMLCVFFAAMALLTAGKTKVGAGAHRGFWLAKAAVLIGLLVSTLFISNETMEQYRQAARYLSFGFLLMQILLLIDFAYTWNETWLNYGEDSDDEGISGWRCVAVLSSLHPPPPLSPPSHPSPKSEAGHPPFLLHSPPRNPPSRLRPHSACRSPLAARRSPLAARRSPLLPRHDNAPPRSSPPPPAAGWASCSRRSRCTP